MATDDALTAEEQALFDSQTETGPAPAPPDQAVSDAAPSVDPDAGAPAVVADPAAADEGDDDAPIAEPAIDPATGKKPPRHVNFNKFKRAEDRAAAAEAALASERLGYTEKMARTDERLRLLTEALTNVPETAKEQAAADADPMPNADEDIFGYAKWAGRELKRQQERYDSRFAELEASRTTERSSNELLTNYRADSQRYQANSEPTFSNALNHLIASRAEEMLDVGVPMDRLLAEVQADEMALVQAAYSQKKNPAEFIFKAAQRRGFNPKDQATWDTPDAMLGRRHAAATGQPAPARAAAMMQPPAARAPGALAPVASAAPAAAPVPNVGAMIDGVVAAQPAATSLSQGGGAPAPVVNSAKIADMSEKDFSALLNKISDDPDKMRELFGS